MIVVFGNSGDQFPDGSPFRKNPIVADTSAVVAMCLQTDSSTVSGLLSDNGQSGQNTRLQNDDSAPFHPP